MEKKIALLHSLLSVNAAKTVEKVRYYSSDAHVNALYFRLGVAAVIQRGSPDLCHVKGSKRLVWSVG